MTPTESQADTYRVPRWSRRSTRWPLLVEGGYLLSVFLTFFALLVLLMGWRGKSGGSLLSTCLAAVAWGGGLGLVAVGWCLPRSPRLGREALLTSFLCLPLVPWFGLLGALGASLLRVSGWAVDPTVAGFCTGGLVAYGVTLAVRLERPLEARE